MNRVDYYNERQGEPLTYLDDMWALHITNTGFRWHKVGKNNFTTRTLPMTKIKIPLDTHK